MLINIVVKPFTSYGKRYLAGQIISDPASIKRFKSKVIEGKIITLYRYSKNTLQHIRFLEKKLGCSIEQEVRDYCKSVDSAKFDDTTNDVEADLEVGE